MVSLASFPSVAVETDKHYDVLVANVVTIFWLTLISECYCCKELKGYCEARISRPIRVNQKNAEDSMISTTSFSWKKDHTINLRIDDTTRTCDKYFFPDWLAIRCSLLVLDGGSVVFDFPLGVLFWEYTDPNIILLGLARKLHPCSIVCMFVSEMRARRKQVSLSYVTTPSKSRGD